MTLVLCPTASGSLQIGLVVPLVLLGALVLAVAAVGIYRRTRSPVQGR